MKHIKMQLFFYIFMFSKLVLSFPKATVIQYAYTEVVGSADTPVITRTLNGVLVPWNYSGHDENTLRDIFLLNTEQENLFEKSLPIILKSFNHTTARNHTYQRMRTCQLEGYRVEWVSDLVRYDGVDYLRLDGKTDTWRAAVPQAQVLQQLWAGDAEHAQNERACLENSCAEMLKDLTQNSLSSVEGPERQEVMSVWFPVLAAVALFGLMLISFLMFKKQVSKGSGLPGGTVGSLIHYPPNLSEISHEANGYQVI
ncbi:hypothetical protein AGOR_G00127730 [Albula goreensis]|uniref:MHC class I-like antigen recognition-like domain-containing protein n=1 Tax=Albula goreensis TaxID=1534307 RepID=A0A8T3DCI8_9TELE|nr:hypothetical protein AGOR_G00127730 [Albula goreensis]